MSTNGTKKKKKSIVKSIAKGLSFKKKKERPDDESVVGVAIDRGVPAAGRKQNTSSAVSQSTPSVPSTPSASSATTSSLAKPIQVVLLLMDPSSRRFELLQLEFDSNKAMVSDVIRQIQSSATETTLRDMTYIGVCDIHGVEMIASMKLSKFCKGNDVVMALPRGMSGRETAKLAGPILGDRKVEEMVSLFSCIYLVFGYTFVYITHTSIDIICTLLACTDWNKDPKGSKEDIASCRSCINTNCGRE